MRAETSMWSRMVGAALAVAIVLGTGAGAAAQGVETAVRVVVVDGETGALTVVDPEAEEVVGRFTTPTGGFVPVYASGSGRYVFATHYEGEAITIVDAGLRAVDHGDHVDLVAGPPFVRATLDIGRAPAHSWAHDGVIAVYSDKEGTVTIVDEAGLAEGADPVTFAVGPPDHASLAVLDDVLLVAFYELGRVDAYDLDGALVKEGVADCPGAHGEGQVGEVVAFACADGVLLVSGTGEDLRARKVGYPGAEGAATPAGTAVAASPEAEPVVDRSNLIAWHEEAPFMVGDFPTGLLLIDATAASMEPVTLPATPLWMAFDAGGERLAVLTDDGVVHAVDPATQEILWSTPATTAYAEFDQEDAARLYPFIAVGEDAVYVPDPGAGQVVELSLDSGEVTGRVDVGGEPARLALVAASGVVH